MKRIILLHLTLSVFFSLAEAQTSETLYRTEDGIVYRQSQLDSIARLGLPIGNIRNEVINDTTFTIIKIYESLEALQNFTAQYKGERLPAFTLKTLEGKQIITTDLKGKVVMFNFWSTTCGSCIKEIPELNALKKNYGKNVVFIAPLPESSAEAKQFLAKHPYDFIIAPNAKDVFEQLGIDGYPKNFFVGKDGIIREVKEGTPHRRDSPEGGWHLSVYEDYSEILDELITSH